MCKINQDWSCKVTVFIESTHDFIKTAERFGRLAGIHFQNGIPEISEIADRAQALEDKHARLNGRITELVSSLKKQYSWEMTLPNSWEKMMIDTLEKTQQEFNKHLNDDPVTGKSSDSLAH